MSHSFIFLMRIYLLQAHQSKTLFTPSLSSVHRDFSFLQDGFSGALLSEESSHLIRIIVTISALRRRHPFDPGSRYTLALVPFLSLSMLNFFPEAYVTNTICGVRRPFNPELSI